jgi:hypothetical protein
MQTLKINNTSRTCILCMLMPQMIPLLILMLLDMFYEESPPQGNGYEVALGRHVGM